MLVFDLKKRRQVDTALAPLMFALSLGFLVGIAVLIVVWVDVPSIQETVTESAASVPFSDGASVSKVALRGLLLIWPVFILESVFHWVVRPFNASTKLNHFYGILFCLCPPLRLCASNPDLKGRMWLPGFGWRKSDRRLRRKMEHYFSRPMLVIAMMILPVLLVEFCLKDQVNAHAWLRLTLHGCTGIIWFAFAAEFIVMVSVSERKLEYCKTNWIDIAIILLPIVSFLRSLRLVKATRLARLTQVSQLSKMARVYRLRGMAMKLLRALLLMEFVHRIIGLTTEKKLDRLRKELAEKQRELAFLEEEISELEAAHRNDRNE